MTCQDLAKTLDVCQDCSRRQSTLALFCGPFVAASCSLILFQYPGSDRSSDSPDVFTRARPRKGGSSWTPSVQRLESKRRGKWSAEREHAQEDALRRDWLAALATNGSDSQVPPGKVSGLVKSVTLLALVSQRFQPHCCRPVMVYFVIIGRSSTFMHPDLPYSSFHPCEGCLGYRYLLETAALI